MPLQLPSAVSAEGEKVLVKSTFPAHTLKSFISQKSDLCVTIRCSPGHHPKCPKQQFQRTDWPPIELTQHSKMSLSLKLAFSQDLRFQSTFNFFFNLGDHRSCRPLSEFRKAEVDISYSVPVGCVTPYVVMKPPLEEAQDTPSALPLFCTHPKETLLFCNIIRVLGPAGN